MPDRPIVMSIVQYTDPIESGSMSVPELVEIAGTLGVDGLELRRELWGAPMADELPGVRSRMAELGLQVTFGTHDVLFCEGDDYEQLLTDVDTAAEIGSPLFRIFTGPVPDDSGDPAWDKAKVVIDRAESNGIVIALENYARSPGGTLAEVKTVLDHFDVPALKTNIDIGNYTGWKQDVVEAIGEIGHRAAYVHVKDPGGAGTSVPGEGDVPMKEVFTALDALPQKIIYCFEFPGKDDPEDRIKRGLAWMRGRA